MIGEEFLIEGSGLLVPLAGPLGPSPFVESLVSQFRLRMLFRNLLEIIGCSIPILPLGGREPGIVNDQRQLLVFPELPEHLRKMLGGLLEVLLLDEGNAALKGGIRPEGIVGRNLGEALGCLLVPVLRSLHPSKVVVDA